MTEDEITICSLNCRGISGKKKRSDVMNYLRKKPYSIICLVDTHFTEKEERFIRSEWGYEAYFNSFNSQSRGIAVFFKNNFEFKLHNTFKDSKGNVLLLDIEIENKRITLATVYGPNVDDPTFYEKLQNNIIKMGNNHIIITGDFNLLLNPVIDGVNYKSVNNQNARDKVLKMMTDINLFDVWRDENPDKQIFTWKRKLSSGEIQMGRLDFFLVSEPLTYFTEKENIIPGYRSDHSAILITLKFNQIKHSKSFWKFNNSLLKNSAFVNEIKNVILDVKKQYALLPYNIDNIDSVENELFQASINPQLFFEVLLLEIRSKTISFSTALNKKEKSLLKQLESDIIMLERTDPAKNFEAINIKQDQLKSIREKKLNGTLVRSRARWISQGEKPSKYFFALENRHFISKRMKSLINTKGEEINDFDYIKNEVNNFYKTLYCSREQEIEDVNLNNILNENTPKLNELEANSIEGNITLKEASFVLNNMKNNKSPGSSGFTTEFFKFFWRDLGTFLLNSINFGYNMKELSVTQKEGIITCIPKGDKCKKHIKNWRPISLLNISYKIASGCIANRIKTVLPSIIHLDQSGFMANRFTGENIRLLYDTLKLSLQKEKPGLLLLIDFEKAFDSVAWSFIKKSLIFFNFKSSIINWIETFYKNIKSTVIINNTPTTWFPIQRGCRQGDPVSPYIFLICSEVLAHMIRQSDRIKGYSLFDDELKISQFADDTMLLLDGSKDSFEYCIFTILEYAKFSGLSMNFEKTKVIWFGCNRPPDIIFMPELNFNWNARTFTVLGIDFTTDLKNISDINITKKIPSMVQEINQWNKRDITPLGKITVIKTLLLSKFVHILISLPSPSIKIMNEINTLLYKFLWNGKPDQVKREIAKQTFVKGGLDMIDFKLFDESLKLSWIRRLNESEAAWVKLAKKAYPFLIHIPKMGDQYMCYILSNFENPFWINVTSFYFRLYKNYSFNSINELETVSFLYNSNIKVNKKTITNMYLADNGIYQIRHLKEGSNFLTFQQFNTLYNTRLNFLQYISIVNSVKAYCRQFKELKNSDHIENHPVYNLIIKNNKGFSKIYHRMTSKDIVATGYLRWIKHEKISNIEWQKLFKKLKYTTVDTKLRWFQYRILHYTLTTNRSVSKFIHSQDHLCTFCQQKSETIIHLLWECPKTNLFWKELAQVLNSRAVHSSNFRFTKWLVIFGTSDCIKTDLVCDLIILLGKYYIYRCKVQSKELSLKFFITELYNRFCVEKEISKNSPLFKIQWAPYTNIFRSLM